MIRVLTSMALHWGRVVLAAGLALALAGLPAAPASRAAPNDGPVYAVDRIDDVIVFNALEKEHIDLIIEIELKKLYARIADLGYKLTLSDKAKAFIAEKGFDKQFGARPLKRAIQRYVEDALAEEIIISKIGQGDEIHMDLADESADELTVTVQKSQEPTT